MALQTQGIAAAVNPVRPYRSYSAITIHETTASSRYHGMLSSFRSKTATTAP